MPRLLFITSTRIGDAVLSTAALEHVRAMIGADGVTIACGALAAPLFRAEPGLEALHTITQRKSGGHWLDLYKTLKQAGAFDCAVDIRGSLTTFFLPAKKRFVFTKRPGLHKLDEFAAMFGKHVSLTPKLYLDDSAEAAARALIPDDRPLLVIALGASNISKMWPADRFEVFARMLMETDLRGGRVVMIGGREDAEMTARLTERLNAHGAETIDAIGKLDLLGSAALMRRASLYVGNDTGPSHIAAAIGARTLVCFGPSDERFYGPRGPRARAVRGPRSPAQIKADGYDRRVHVRSWLDDLEVETVLAAARDMLKEAT